MIVLKGHKGTCYIQGCGLARDEQQETAVVLDMTVDITVLEAAGVRGAPFKQLPMREEKGEVAANAASCIVSREGVSYDNASSSFSETERSILFYEE